MYAYEMFDDVTKNCEVRTGGAKKRTALPPIAITETLLSCALLKGLEALCMAL